MIERLVTNRIFQVSVLLVLLCAAVMLSFSHARWREQIRNFTFDTYNILKPRTVTGDIAIVDIDEASMREIGQMPWPRDVMAQMVENLKSMGAKVIVFDIVFPEEDRSSPKAIRKALQSKDIETALEGMADHDEMFGKAIGKAGNVVTGFSFTNEETGSVPVQKGIFRGKNIEMFVPTLRGASSNLKVISKPAAGNGSFFVSTDVDGIIRRVPMLVAHARQESGIVSVYPSLALETVRVLDGERGGRVVLGDERYATLDPNRFGIEGVEIGSGRERVIPTNARGEFQVYFAKSNKDWYVSAVDVLNKTVAEKAIKGKIVFVGTSAVGLKDIRSTPLDTFVPGVEVHLNIVDQILQGAYLNRSIEAEGIEAVTILLAGVFIIVFAPFIGAFLQAVVVAAVIGVAIYGGWFAFVQHGLLIDVAYPVVSLLAIFMLSTILTYLRSEKERRQVRDAFGLYISPDYMQELTKNPEALQLGGQLKELSVMFTDIRKFTSISEGMEPQDLIQLMNDFLTPMSDLVMQNRGTIDKYMGDAMMAFWNAPLDDKDHARHACMTALGMQKALDPINERLKNKAQEAGEPSVLLEAGIGINTGPCAVGNMGSRQRFAYSALGDAVNLASRLEGQTKYYGVGIIIGEETEKHVKDFATLELDLIRVKGREQPVRIFALSGGEETANDSAFVSWKNKHDKMIKAYRAGDFSRALELAQECRVIQTGHMERLYEIYYDRCQALLNDPPAGDWTGVYEAETK